MSRKVLEYYVQVQHFVLVYLSDYFVLQRLRQQLQHLVRLLRFHEPVVEVVKVQVAAHFVPRFSLQIHLVHVLVQNLRVLLKVPFSSHHKLQ